MPLAPYQRAHVALARSMGGSGRPSRVKIDIVDYNDTHPHRQVLSAWDRAIQEIARLQPKQLSAVAMLRGGLHLIRSKKRWLQHQHAQGRSGREVNIYSRSACAFCSDGALRSQWTRDVPYEIFHAAETALQSAMKGNVFVFNDTHTYEHVVAAWRSAIKNLQGAVS